MNIDWSKAPESASHFSFGDKSAGKMDAWWRPHPTVVGKYWCWAIGSSFGCGKWQEHGFDLPRNAVACKDEGLPTIGSHVFVHDDGSLIYGHGESGEVLAHVDGTAVIRMSYGLGCFLPRCLRTQDQIAAEERKAAVSEMFNEAQVDFSAGDLMSAQEYVIRALAALYDKGYRKEVKP